MKRLIVSALVVVFGSFSVLFMTPATNVNAINCDAESKSAVKAFLEFPTWYRGFELEQDSSGKSCVLKKNAFEGEKPGPLVFKIALNIIDIILRIIGLAAVGFIIWGGFQYIISRGDPERSKTGMITIRNAIVGLIISMVAAMVVSFVVSRLST